MYNSKDLSRCVMDDTSYQAVSTLSHPENYGVYAPIVNDEQVTIMILYLIF